MIKSERDVWVFTFGCAMGPLTNNLMMHLGLIKGPMAYHIVPTFLADLTMVGIVLAVAFHRAKAGRKTT